MKKITINKWNVSQFDTAALVEAQNRTNDRRKIAMIQAELDIRKATGSGDKPASIEDML